MAFDLEAVRRGEKAAWDAFVDRYARVIHAAVYKVAGTRSDVDHATHVHDIVQDVFVRLVRNDFKLLKNYDPAKASLTTWLTIVARSTTLDYLRKKKLDTVPIDDRDAGVGQLAATGNPNPEEAAAGLDEGSALQSLNVPEGLLSERQTLVLHLLFDKDMEVPEAAAMMGVNAQTIRSTKHKAMERLRKHFEQNPPEQA